MAHNYNKYLCTFADKRLQKTLHRFEDQANKMKFYNGIYLYDETLLPSDFLSRFGEKFKEKGFGYWVWKPKVILMTLDKMQNGDILQYSDAGCHFNPKGIQRLKEYFELVNSTKSSMLGFQMENQPEKKWTKGDLFQYFDFQKHHSSNSNQIWAGTIFIKKSDRTVDIIKEYLNVFYENFSLTDDSPSESPNFPEFFEHRYDQSIWSILAKKNEITLLPHSENYSTDYSLMNEFPIWAKRDKQFKKKWNVVLVGRIRSLKNLIKMAFLQKSNK